MKDMGAFSFEALGIRMRITGITKHGHVGGDRRLDTGHTVLDDDTIGGLMPHRLCSEEKEIGPGLALGHLFGAEKKILDQGQKARTAKRETHLLELAG